MQVVLHGGNFPDLRQKSRANQSFSPNCCRGCRRQSCGSAEHEAARALTAAEMPRHGQGDIMTALGLSGGGRWGDGIRRVSARGDLG